jgi:ABC-type multidrug transport system ATPase subunit
VLSFLFAKHPDAQMWTRLGYSGATIILFFGSFILEFPSLGGSSRGLQIAGDVFMYVAMLFPPYALSKGFADVTIKGQCNAALVAAGQPCEPPSAFTWGLAGAKLLVMACIIPISMAALMWIEYRTVKETRVDVTVAEAAATVGSAAPPGMTPGVHGKQVGGVGAAAAAPLAPPSDLPPHLRDAWAEAQRRGALSQPAGPLAAGGRPTAAPDVTGVAIEDDDVVAERQRIDAGLRAARAGAGASTAHGGYNAAGGWDVEADGYGALPGSTPERERGPTGLTSSSSLSASARAGSPLGGHFTPAGTPSPDAGEAAVRPTDAATAQLAGRGLTAVHLRKVYSGSGTGALPKVAVADLSFRVRPGEVFGLLGANGAGKTTTLSMLVAETTPSAGTAVVYGRDITAARRSALDIMGYCPQHDALFDLLTGAETLAYFAAINGVPAEHLPALVDAALSALDLQRYRDTLTRAYSGGNKRRLSLALAYVAAPLVVYLDECSTGVDPFARRRMFDVVQRARVGRSTVMTTHVLEDADGLCDRLAIMVDGRFACLGSSQHLKGRYGKGYSIELHLSHNGPGAHGVAGALGRGSPSVAAGAGSDLGAHNTVATPVSPLPLGAGGEAGSPANDAAAAERVTAITALVLQGAPAARLVESSSGHLRFEAPSVSLAVMFGTLEAHKAAAGIREYSVSQTTLEAVFLGFSRLQEQADERRRMVEAEFRAAAAAASGQ